MNPNSLSRNFMLIIAFAVGTIVANNYYVQPIIGLMARSLELLPSQVGFISTATQIGYGAGVFFLIPMGDIIDPKKLILSMITVTILGSLGLAYAPFYEIFILCALMTGIVAASVQVLIPYISGLVPEERSGKAVGTLMSGLMLGIMLSRPLSSLVSEIAHWTTIFIVSAILMSFTLLLMMLKLPSRPPQIQEEGKREKLKYLNILKHMATLFLNESVLQRRAFYQFCLFSSFCLFWTAAPYYLEKSAYQFNHSEIALFALAGVAGAIAAPFAGKAADAGKAKEVTLLALTLSIFSYILTLFAPEGSIIGIILMVSCALLLDAGVTLSMVTGQREVFAISPALRSRLNGVFVSFIFIGGGFGSALGAWSIENWGWISSATIGLSLPALALVFFLQKEFLPLYKKSTQ